MAHWRGADRDQPRVAGGGHHGQQPPGRPQRLWLFSTKTTQGFWDARYAEGDGLVFGSESSGAPEAVHAFVGSAQTVKIPHFNDLTRSLNLSTACGIATYEALRQVKG